jgi:hypothetical protein
MDCRHEDGLSSNRANKLADPRSPVAALDTHRSVTVVGLLAHVANERRLLEEPLERCQIGQRDGQLARLASCAVLLLLSDDGLEVALGRCGKGLLQTEGRAQRRVSSRRQVGM